MREVWIEYNTWNSCSRVGLGSALSCGADGRLEEPVDILLVGMDVCRNFWIDLKCPLLLICGIVSLRMSQVVYSIHTVFWYPFNYHFGHYFQHPAYV